MQNDNNQRDRFRFFFATTFFATGSLFPRDFVNGSIFLIRPIRAFFFFGRSAAPLPLRLRMPSSVHPVQLRRTSQTEISPRSGSREPDGASFPSATAVAIAIAIAYTAAMKYVPSMFIGQLSGSEGSNTASHNRYASYFRNRTIPVNPRTPAQTLVRDALTSFSQNWRNLSQSAQTAWQQIADLVPIQNSQGQTIILSGQAFYVRFNLQRRSVALARLDVAPAAVEVPPSFTSATVVLNGTGAILTVSPIVVDGTGTNFALMYATPVLGPGINFIKPSDYRVFSAPPASDPVPNDRLAAYEAVFGAGWRTQIGMRIAFKFKGISDAGFQGDSIEIIDTII